MPLKILRAAEALAEGAALAGTVLWGTLAIWFWTAPRWVSLPIGALYLAAVAGALWRLRPFRKGVAAAIGAFALLMAVWFATMPASDTRDWQRDVMQAPYAEIEGRRVTIHNVRNCLYRSEADYDVRYESRTYDLDKLRHGDMYLVDWGLRHVAHTMFSFGFEDGQFLCVSIETRKEVGESYSSIKGFFRQYELIYVAADERDVVGLRANFRKGEDVYLYRLQPRDPKRLEAVFMEYVDRMNQLKARPEWYNALTDNCMTSAYKNIRKHAVDRPWNWRILLNGYSDELAYSEGLLAARLPFAELRAAARVNDRARAADPNEDFSAAIRRGMPGMEQAAAGPAAADPGLDLGGGP